MYVAIKTIILLLGVVAAVYTLNDHHAADGILAAGCFLAYALLETTDVKMLNKK